MTPCTALEPLASPLEVFAEEPAHGRLAFSRLLEWLDDGTDSHGATYIEMHRRLVSYFNRRDRMSADELADETLNRISRTLEKDGAIATTPPARYCYVTARFVLLEDIRREQREHRPRGGHGGDAEALRAMSPELDEVFAIRERRLDCLDRCLQELDSEQRALVVEYYQDAGRQKIVRRRDIAERLGITMNALGIRVCRIRAVLEKRVEARINEPRHPLLYKR